MTLALTLNRTLVEVVVIKTISSQIFNSILIGCPCGSFATIVSFPLTSKFFCVPLLRAFLAMPDFQK
jgi:hypothetical protein